MTKNENNLDFDTIIKELNIIVSKMERGDLKLEESIDLFKKGMMLTKEGEKKLQEARHQVDILIQTGLGSMETKPLNEAE